MNKHINIVIIGGQGGGMTCAAKLSRELPNSTITVIEQQDYISLGACGLPYYIEGLIKDSSKLISKVPSDYDNTNINIKIQHKVISVNYANKEITIINLLTNQQSILNYTYLIIASGAKSNIVIENSNRVSTVKNIADTNIILNAINKLQAKNIAIIGGGYIALELLGALTHYNLNVSIIDKKLHIIEKFLDKDFAPIIEAEIQQHKINLLLNTSITSVTNNADNVQIVVSQNNEPQTLNFDLVIQCIGSTPNTNFLGNEIEKNPNGAILVNAFGKTNINNVYACGDCVALKHSVINKFVNIQLATLSNKLAKIIADNIAAEVNNNNNFTKFESVLGSSALKLFNLEIAKTGITEAEAIENNIVYKSAFVKEHTLPGYMPNNSVVYGKIIFCANTNIILGAQIIGPNALNKINTISLAIATKTTINTLATLDFGYTPTFNKTIDFLNILATVALKA